MKSITHISILIALLLSSCIYGQQIEGIATYKSHRKFDVELDSTMNDGMQEQIRAMLMKQSQKEYNLQFRENESEYKQEATLDDNNTISGGGMRIIVAGSGGNDVLYKNLKENRYAEQVEMFGKQFLVKDALETPEWKLHKETKNIGQYTCFKATYTRTRTIMVAETNDDGVNPESSEHSEEEEIEVTAWYTPQIPVKNGPSDYHGLPGLILEVNDGMETLLCSKIVLNPEKGIDIDEPTKGKEVNDEEYRDILEKKMKEMNEQFQGDGRKGDGNRSFSIKIGG